MIPVVIAIGAMLMVLERIKPDQELPEVKGWWIRVVLINIAQLLVVLLGQMSWDKWLQSYSLIETNWNPLLGGFVSYLIVTFVFYWWHRWRHRVNWLWLAFHQIHHSPQRIETITSFYKHPFEIAVNSIMIATVNYVLLGIGIEGAAWTLFFTASAEFFYHMNIKTPHWIGYFLQRPEMHRIHHQRNKHYMNFSDLPAWDMLFGTYVNPPTYKGLCGFKPEREARFWDMIRFTNVNNPLPKNPGEA